MKRDLVAFQLVNFLESRGVETVFGLCGHTLIGLLDALNSDQYPMRPKRILKDLREVLPRDGFVVADVGWNKNGVGQQMND